MLKEYLLYGLNEPFNDLAINSSSSNIAWIFQSSNPISLDIISILCIISCILCVSINNPVISVLFLISLFANVGLYLIILGITFIGLVYIVVYVGAVTILFLFVIMLINIQLSEIKTYNLNNGIPVGLGIGVSFWFILYFLLKNQINTVILLNNTNNTNTNGEVDILNNTRLLTQSDSINLNLDKAISTIWDSNILDISQISSIGYMMYSTHFIWFILVSLILLLAMIGAIQLTLKE